MASLSESRKAEDISVAIVSVLIGINIYTFELPIALLIDKDFNLYQWLDFMLQSFKEDDDE